MADILTPEDDVKLAPVNVSCDIYYAKRLSNDEQLLQTISVIETKI
jgi:hypothetical protein